MQWALHILDELRDTGQRKPPFEGPPPGRAPAFQPPPQRLVGDVAERPVAARRFRLELGRHIIVKGERRPHDLMLRSRHHDAKAFRPTATTCLLLLKIYQDRVIYRFHIHSYAKAGAASTDQEVFETLC